MSALPTIKKVISDGGKAIIISHLGRPKNGFEDCEFINVDYYRYSVDEVIEKIAENETDIPYFSMEYLL